jgi:hypothetical protein
MLNEESQDQISVLANPAVLTSKAILVRLEEWAMSEHLNSSILSMRSRLLSLGQCASSKGWSNSRLMRMCNVSCDNFGISTHAWPIRIVEVAPTCTMLSTLLHYNVLERQRRDRQPRSSRNYNPGCGVATAAPISQSLLWLPSSPEQPTWSSPCWAA